LSGRPDGLLSSGLGLSLVALLVLAAPRARADGDPMAECIAASDKGIDLRKQGKLVEARQALATCAAASCGADISNVCRKRIADINATLPSIVFLPKDGAGRDIVGVTITVDGAGASQVLDGRAIPLDPGAHTFRFEAAGEAPVERSFVIVEGARDRQERIDIGPTQAASPSVPATSQAPPAPPPPPSGSSHRTAVYAVGAAGIVGVAVGSVFGLLASSQWSTSKTDCATKSSCSNYPRAVSEHDTAATDATVSTVAFIVGGAALATSAVLFLTTPGSASTTGRSETSLRLEARAAPGGAGLTLVGGFR
jgi:hypothetical protein